MGGLTAAAAPAHAYTIYPRPIWTDPYPVSLYTTHTASGCQGVTVVGQGLPAFNYQSGLPGGWVGLYKVGPNQPNGGLVDYGSAWENKPPERI